MNSATTALATLLRMMLVLLPREDRDWGEAVLSETAEVPTGRARLSWLAGGIRLVVRESGLIRRLTYTFAGLAAGVTLVWLDRHPGSADPGEPTSRVMDVVKFLAPAIVPWLARPLFGPVAQSRTARAVRIGGYGGIYALMLVMVDVSRYAGSRFDDDAHDGMTSAELANWTAGQRTGAFVGGILVTAVLGGYAFGLLAITSRRLAIAPATLALGSGCGIVTALLVYALSPLGTPLHVGNRVLESVIYAGIALVPLAALFSVGRLAGRRAASTVMASHPGTPDAVDQAAWDASARQGRFAGLLAAAVLSVLLSVVTVATMLLFPHSIRLVWANPDRDAPHGTTYEWQMSLGDSAEKYEIGLMYGPLVGFALGIIGATCWSSPIEVSRSRRRRAEILRGMDPPGAIQTGLGPTSQTG